MSAATGQVQVVTDSTSDIAPDDAQRLGVSIVAVHIFFGDDHYRDGVNITPAKFYQRLISSNVMPRTSQPSPQDFAEVIGPLAKNGPVLGLTISSKMSGTYNSALLARDIVLGEQPDAVIEIVDTLSVAIGLGDLAQRAAARASEGIGLEELAAWARDTASRTRLYFAVDTLEYLARGGRIGRAQRFLGGLLSVKPVLEFRDGEVHPLERVRSRQKAHARLEALVYESGAPERVAFASTTDHARAREMAERASERLGLEDIPVYTIGAAVGTYAGPGCIGVAFVLPPGQGMDNRP